MTIILLIAVVVQAIVIYRLWRRLKHESERISKLAQAIILLDSPAQPRPPKPDISRAADPAGAIAAAMQKVKAIEDSCR